MPLPPALTRHRCQLGGDAHSAIVAAESGREGFFGERMTLGGDVVAHHIFAHHLDVVSENCRNLSSIHLKALAELHFA